MSAAEIAAEYRQAKKPLLQLGILADMNGCTKKEIAAVLREQGCELPERYKTASAAKANTSSGAGAPPSPQGEGNESQGRGSDAGESLESRSIMQLADLAYEGTIAAQRLACRLLDLLSGEEYFPSMKAGEPVNLRDMLAENVKASAYAAELLELAVDTLGGGADD